MPHLATVRTWARSLASPKTRLLPGLGARLGRHPRAASLALAGLRRLPSARLRAAAYRHVSLPLVQRMDGDVEVSIAPGIRMVTAVSTVVGRMLATSGVCEWYVTEVFRSLLRPGDVVIDVGANVGYYTAIGAQAVGPSGHVYALEPAPDTVELLRRTVATNDLAHVTVLEVAAGAAEGTATLVGSGSGHDDKSTLAYTRDANAVATRVPVRPLHAVVEARHRDRLGVVKIDVEGYEAEVLAGLALLLEAGCAPTIVLEVHTVFAPDAPASVAAFCARTGYRAARVVDDEGRPYELAPADRRVEIVPIGSPDEIRSIADGRFILVLEPPGSSRLARAGGSAAPGHLPA